MKSDKRLLFSSSFIPLSASDSVPQFIREQLISMARARPNLKILALAASRAGSQEMYSESNLSVTRFSYWFTKNSQHLTNLGILPAIKSRKWSVLQLLPLFVVETVSLWRVAKKFKPAYVYSHWFLPQALINHFIAKRFGAKHFFTTHSSDVDACGKLPFIGPMLVRMVLRGVTAGTAVSERVLISLSKYFSLDEWHELSPKFIVLPMGVNLPKLDEVDVNSNSPKHLLCMGRLIEKKGFDRLLKAFKRCLDQQYDLYLTVAGSGPMERELKLLAVELGISSRVNFSGFVTEDKKAEIIKKCDIFVLPSVVSSDGDREGLPVTLMENMSYGNLCIATRESGAEEIIVDGENGFLCQPDNVEELSDLIVKVCTFSEIKRNSLNMAAWSAAQNFSWAKVTEKMLAHFERLGEY